MQIIIQISQEFHLQWIYMKFTPKNIWIFLPDNFVGPFCKKNKFSSQPTGPHTLIKTIKFVFLKQKHIAGKGLLGNATATANTIKPLTTVTVDFNATERPVTPLIAVIYSLIGDSILTT